MSILATDVRELRDRVHERGSPAMAIKLVRIVSGMGNWAVDEGKLTLSPAKGIRARSKENARDRVLTDGEIGAFWRACDGLGYPQGPIGKLLLLTAMRVRETGQLPWDELSLDHRIWNLPANRTKP
jgi:integrase